MPSAEHPNLLLITTDQQRFDTLRAAGNRSILTPHLDWLADSGVRYSRAYADCPVCAPSRATIMTGLHAWRHGQTVNPPAHVPSPMAARPTLPGLLSAAGYQTRLVGKAHFHPMRAHYGFEHMELPADFFRALGRRPSFAPPKDHGLGENEIEPVFSTAEERHTLTHWIAERSIEFLETRDDTRPFFLWTSFTKPHPPFDCLPAYWNLYDGVPLPAPCRGDWSAAPDGPPPGFREPDWKLSHVARLSPEHLRNSLRAYYACITQIDYNLGLLFARLRELKLIENTWIIFTSDHGEMLGDHGLGSKSVFFEGSAHVPLIVRPPGGAPASVDDRLACLADLLPTFAARAGLPPPAACDGLDLLGVKRRDHLVGECGPFHALLTESHAYHFTELGGAELAFNLAADPGEKHDLLRAPSPAPEALALRSRLAAHLAARGHTCARDGVLVATRPAPEFISTRARAWPGFHHREGPPSDMLH
jgi:arylsulfatase A-like enzyme